MIAIKIDYDKIPQNRLYRGKKGNYANCVLFANKNGRDEYGYDGFVAMEVSREEREQGQRGEIIGNWKELSRNGGAPEQQRSAPARRPAPASSSFGRDVDPEDVPF